MQNSFKKTLEPLYNKKTDLNNILFLNYLMDFVSPCIYFLFYFPLICQLYYLQISNTLQRSEYIKNRHIIIIIAIATVEEWRLSVTIVTELAFDQKGFSFLIKISFILFSFCVCVKIQINNKKNEIICK